MSGSGEPPYQPPHNGASRYSRRTGVGQSGSLSRSTQRGFWQTLFGIGRRRSVGPSSQNRPSRVSSVSPQLPPVQQPRNLSSSSSPSNLRSQPAAHVNGASNGRALTALPSTNGNGTVRSLPPRRLKPQPSTTLALSSRSSSSLVAQPGSSHDRSLAAQRNGASSRLKRRPSTPPSRRKSVALYATRLLILTLGIGVLAGTLLSAWDPAGKIGDAAKSPKQAAIKSGKPEPFESKPVILGSEIIGLKEPLQTLMVKDPKLKAGTFFLDLDSNSYVDVDGATPFAAASTIKFPILVAFFQDVDAGKIHLDEPLTMTKELIAKESGDMQFQPPGTKFTALETATKMIMISDNTATNMLIARLGGISALNQRFRSWGLVTTTLNNLLPDMAGTNKTSAKEQALLLARVSRGDLVSVKSRDRMLAIMQKTVTSSMLPRGLGEGATIAHKTGDIGTTVGDVGLIDVPNGKRYVGAVFVNRPRNDDSGPELVRQISRLTYQNFAKSNPLPTPSPSPTPSSSPAATNSPQPL